MRGKTSELRVGRRGLRRPTRRRLLRALIAAGVFACLSAGLLGASYWNALSLVRGDLEPYQSVLRSRHSVTRLAWPQGVWSVGFDNDFDGLTHCGRCDYLVSLTGEVLWSPPVSTFGYLEDSMIRMRDLCETSPAVPGAGSTVTVEGTVLRRIQASVAKVHSGKVIAMPHLFAVGVDAAPSTASRLRDGALVICPPRPLSDTDPLAEVGNKVRVRFRLPTEPLHSPVIRLRADHVKSELLGRDLHEAERNSEVIPVPELVWPWGYEEPSAWAHKVWINWLHDNVPTH